MTKRRNVIYVSGQPGAAADVGFLRVWGCADQIDASLNTAGPPSHKDVTNYLRAFYHGMQLKTLPADTFHFANWEDERPKSKKKANSANPRMIGLANSTEMVGIRTRLSPDKKFQQLNLTCLPHHHSHHRSGMAIFTSPARHHARRRFLVLDPELMHDDPWLCSISHPHLED